MQNIKNQLVRVLAVCLLTVFVIGRSVEADEIYSLVTSPIVPGVIDAVPPVDRVPGKEFTDFLDMDYRPTPHTALPSQLGMFDGQGGAQNGLRLGDFDTALANSHVDAQSQVRDTLYSSVVRNRVPLVVSTSFDRMLGSNVSLAAETTTGSIQSFARSTQIVNHPHVNGSLRDINSVDLWGPEAVSSAGFYSFNGDSDGVSVYAQTLLAPGGITPYLSRNDIATALGNPNLAPLIDVDAMMVDDVGTGFNPFDGNFGPGDSLMFSIAPIPNPDGGPDFFDGGEIWVWNHGQPAEFLDHGGHLWNTAFDVQGTFRVTTENIDGLEAVSVPEPISGLWLFVAMSGSLLGLSRRS